MKKHNIAEKTAVLWSNLERIAKYTLDPMVIEYYSKHLLPDIRALKAMKSEIRGTEKDQLLEAGSKLFEELERRGYGSHPTVAMARSEFYKLFR